MSGAFLGPRFDPDEIATWLDGEGIEYQRVASDAERFAHVAERLADGAIVGWFCGRMEFGPRALGHRSILADPRSPTVQRRLNAMVKERAVVPAVRPGGARRAARASGSISTPSRPTCCWPLPCSPNAG